MLRRTAAAALACTFAIVVAGCSGSGAGAGTNPPAGSSTSAAPPTALVVDAGVAKLRLSASRRAQLASLPDADATAQLRSTLARMRTAHGPHWSADLRWSAADLATILTAVRGDAPSAALAPPVAAVQIRLPAIHQRYRNDCEATSLAMLLDNRFDQATLQDMLAKAAPTAPLQQGDTTIWGDPELGFVGLADGYGYGVYDRPVLRLLRRYQPDARNLTMQGLPAVLGALRAGRPVIAWIQLGGSLPRTWTSPTGVVVRANFAEHAVLLTGYRRGVLSYNNPWTGARETFTVGEFLPRWHLLGDRAVAGSSLFAGA